MTKTHAERLGLLEDIAIGARFVMGLPGFLRCPVTLEEARATIRRRLEMREADFLALVRRSIYACPSGTYRQLLSLAGCEFGDLEQEVSREGVEGALRTLHRSGVYLSMDEFKARRPVVRGSTRIEIGQGQFSNPSTISSLLMRTGGSTGSAPAVVATSFAARRANAIRNCLVYPALGGSQWQHAIWFTPGGAAVGLLLQLAVSRMRVVRWFSQVDPAAHGLHPRYRWSDRLLCWTSMLAGVRLPRPESVPLSSPLPVARWMVDTLRRGATPNLITFASSAALLCRAALAAGLDLRGARLMLWGEPMTAARLAVIRQAGAEPLPTYGSAETDGVGMGCLRPEASDDLHLYDDMHAVIQPGAGAEQEEQVLPPKALLFSSLRPTASPILLNVSLGDQAELLQRACSCPLERIGWKRHLHTIRSFGKITVGGMTLLDADAIRVVDEVLPARFGGAATDYQLVEEELDDGRPRLRLVVHPSLGPLDAGAVADVFLTELGRGSGTTRVVELQWRQTELLVVDRAAPTATGAGKILHVVKGYASEQRSATVRV